MGMTVIGTIENIRLFNFTTSSPISFIEYDVMSSAYNSTFSSVAMELFYLASNYSTHVEAFEYNGFIIIKSTFNDFMVVDFETGIVRDIDTINNCYGGTYAFGGRKRNMGNYSAWRNQLLLFAVLHGMDLDIIIGRCQTHGIWEMQISYGMEKETFISQVMVIFLLISQRIIY
nr:hypothetical protein [uncultured Methanobacterium sp.]